MNDLEYMTLEDAFKFVDEDLPDGAAFAVAEEIMAHYNKEIDKKRTKSRRSETS